MIKKHIHSLVLFTKYGYTCSHHDDITCRNNGCALHDLYYDHVGSYCENTAACKKLVTELLLTLSEEELLEALL